MSLFVVHYTYRAGFGSYLVNAENISQAKSIALDEDEPHALSLGHIRIKHVEPAEACARRLGVNDISDLTDAIPLPGHAVARWKLETPSPSDKRCF